MVYIDGDKYDLKTISDAVTVAHSFFAHQYICHGYSIGANRRHFDDGGGAHGPNAGSAASIKRAVAGFDSCGSAFETRS